MPIVKEHPQIEGAWIVAVTPSEPSPGGEVNAAGLALSLSAARVNGAGAVITATLLSTEPIDSAWVDLLLAPTDADIAVSALTPAGVGTSFTFTLTVTKATVGLFTRVLSAELDSTASGGLTGIAAATFVIDTEGPDAVTALAGEARIDGVKLTWGAPTAEDIGYYEVYKGTSSTVLGRTVDRSYYDSAAYAGLTYDYWVRAVDTVGNLGVLVGPVMAGPRQIITADIQDAAIMLSKLGEKITDAYRVSAVPVVDPSTTFGVTPGNLTVTNFRLWKNGTGYPVGGAFTASYAVSTGNLAWFRMGESVLRTGDRTSYDATFNEALGDVLLGTVSGSGTFEQSWNSTVVRTGQLLAGAVTAQTIAASAVTADKVAAGAITATKLGIIGAAYDPGTFTSNSPASGYVAWSNLVIVVDGVTYGPFTGNGGGYFVWFDRSAGTVQATGSTGGGVTTPYEQREGDVLLGFNLSGVFAPHWSGTVIQGDTIRTGSIEAKHINVSTLSAISANIGVVSAGRVQDTDAISDPTGASSTRGLRFSTSYGLGGQWLSTNGAFLDLAAGLSGAGNDVFLKAGSVLTVQVGTNPLVVLTGQLTATGLFTASNINASGVVTVSGGLRATSLIISEGSDWGGGAAGARNFFVDGQFRSTMEAQLYQANTLSSTVIQFGGDYFTPNQLVGCTIFSPDTGEYREVIANTHGTLTVSSAWSHVSGGYVYIYSIPYVLHGQYTIQGSSAGDYSQGSWGNATTLATVNDVETTSSVLGSGNILSGRAAASDGQYRYAFTTAADASSMTDSSAFPGNGTASATGRLYYRLSSGAGWTLVTTRLVTADKGASAEATVSGTASIGGVSSYLEFGVDVSVSGEGMAVTGTVTGVAGAGQISWSDAGTGASPRRNVRLMGTAFPYYPHLTFEPWSVVPGDSIGRRGDVVCAYNGTTYSLYFHNGTAWQTL